MSIRMMSVMTMCRVTRELHAIADYAADDCARRACHDRAGGCADRRTAGTAAVLRPVITECAPGRPQQRCAEHGCCHGLISHNVTSYHPYCAGGAHVARRE